MCVYSKILFSIYLAILSYLYHHFIIIFLVLKELLLIISKQQDCEMMPSLNKQDKLEI